MREVLVVGHKTPLGRQSGMTLVEIMIALLIGAFLLGGVLQIFINSRQTYRMQENLSRLQENGRFAMEFISRDLRMAGYLGCASLGAVTPAIDASPQNPNPNPAVNPFTNLNAIVGNNNIANSWNANACSGTHQCIANTDAVTIQYADSCGGYLTGNMASDNANIQIPANNTCNISQYDTLLLSDCSSADVFVATSASSGAGKQTIAHANNQNTSPKLSKVYGADAEIFVFRSYSYFIRTGASGMPALWRLDNAKAVASSSNPMELLEDIEDFQILYGEDTNADGTANYYVPANSVVNVGNVISIRISVLVATHDDNLASQPLAYTFNGTTTTPVDRRLRRVFTSTLAVRNRLNS
ncbi:PilW family protein [Methylomonas montana]|uniref:PilW family protein n=1 Tax=Methylomonas montana TaxID=3058963 RepID=UPI00265935FA|nr:PilW family protein [Methylomonas montana]WKJ89760.1 PilW family protein [Methylomonas montana]